MPKRPAAPKELTEAFRKAAFEEYEIAFGAHALCFPRRYDLAGLSCAGRHEAFHFIGKQRIRNVLGGMFIACSCDNGIVHNRDGTHYCFACEGVGLNSKTVDNLILLAEWDPRNAGAACVGHHRRLDGHATPDLTVPYKALPERVVEFAEDWGLELALEERYPR